MALEIIRSVYFVIRAYWKKHSTFILSLLFYLSYLFLMINLVFFTVSFLLE